MGTDSLQDFNRLRKEEHYKDEAEENYLLHINKILQPDEIRSYQDLKEKEPTLFVFGLPRSGTTFMTQVLAHSFDIGYINNCIARFWLAPVAGIKLSKSIYGNDPLPEFESNYASTGKTEDIHEFGYFWRYWLKKDSIIEILNSKENNINIRWDDLRKTILNMHNAFGKGWICKNIFGAYHLKKLSTILDKSFFVYIERDPADVAFSIMEARIRFYHDPKLWWSTIPYEYQKLKDLPVKEQIAGQVFYLRKFYEEELLKIDNRRYIKVTYREVTENPKLVIANILEKISNHLGIELETREGLPDQFPFKSYKNTDKEEFHQLIKKF